MILLLGSSGYVGTEFMRQLDSYVTIKHTDIVDENFLREFIRDNEIVLVINCAGYVGKPNVDACETQREETFDGNVLFPLMVQRACSGIATLGHVSTGCIYNEDDPENPSKEYTELDEPNFDFLHGNCSFFSGTKALAEKLLMEKQEDLYIWRLRMPFSSVPHRKNIITKFHKFSDVLMAKNSMSRLSDFVRCCIECFIKRVPFGIYNMTNGGHVYFPDFVRDIEKAIYINELSDLDIDDDKYIDYEYVIEKEYVTQSQLNEVLVVPRSNCILSNSKLLNTGIQMDDVHTAIEKCLRTYKE